MTVTIAMKINEEYLLNDFVITHDNSNLISPDTTFLIAGLRVTVTSTFPGASVM